MCWGWGGERRTSGQTIESHGFTRGGASRGGLGSGLGRNPHERDVRSLARTELDSAHPKRASALKRAMAVCAAVLLRLLACKLTSLTGSMQGVAVVGHEARRWFGRGQKALSF